MRAIANAPATVFRLRKYRRLPLDGCSFERPELDHVANLARPNFNTITTAAKLENRIGRGQSPRGFQSLRTRVRTCLDAVEADAGMIGFRDHTSDFSKA